MNDVLAVGLSSWYAFPLGLLVVGISLGLMPGVLLRLFVKIYPKDSPRRAEAIAELYMMSYLRRIPWVFQQLDMSIFEGGRERIRTIRANRERRRTVYILESGLGDNKTWHVLDETQVLLHSDSSTGTVRLATVAEHFEIDKPH